MHTFLIMCTSYLQGVTDNKNTNLTSGSMGARLYVEGVAGDENILKLLLTVVSLLPESDVELTSAKLLNVQLLN